MWGHGLNRACSGYGKLAGACECGNGLPGSKNAEKFLSSCKPVSFTERTVLHGLSE